jgi:hypothetical protein
MAKDYTHELNGEIRSISGGYVLVEEGNIVLGGREVLYIIGNAAVDGACCGSYKCCFAVVPGFLLRWKYRKNDTGVDVSEVEPIADQQVRKEIETRLRAVECVAQVIFL